MQKQHTHTHISIRNICDFDEEKWTDANAARNDRFLLLLLLVRFEIVKIHIAINSWIIWNFQRL